MTEKATIEQRLIVSDEAKRLLNDTVFNSLISVLLKDYLTRLVNTVPGSPEGIRAHAGVLALEDIKGMLKSLENDGHVIRSQNKS